MVSLCNTEQSPKAGRKAARASNLESNVFALLASIDELDYSTVLLSVAASVAEVALRPEIEVHTGDSKREMSCKNFLQPQHRLVSIPCFRIQSKLSSNLLQ